ILGVGVAGGILAAAAAVLAEPHPVAQTSGVALFRDFEPVWVQGPGDVGGNGPGGHQHPAPALGAFPLALQEEFNYLLQEAALGGSIAVGAGFLLVIE